MSTILLEHIDTLATFDRERTRLKDAWVLVSDNRIEALGPAGSEPHEADQRIDLSGHVVIPGMINTHHHNFQTMLRNVPRMQGASLFPWLNDLYLLMSEVTDEDNYISTLVAHAELLLSGCTTTVDHSYLKVNDMQFETEIRAAQESGMRFHLARGSFSIGQSQGGLPPDHIVEAEDDILESTEALIKNFHDPHPFAMVRIDNAPCSPFSVSERVMRESIAMARRYGVGNHTHLAENMDDHRYVMQRFGMSSVRMAESLGWVGPDVWFAHGVVLDEDDMDIMARTGTAIAHCPCSNQFLGSGVCKVTPMLRRGVTIGVGVDGSASNNSSNMLDEVRTAFLLQRVTYGANALAPTQALEMATLGGARLLRRPELGVIAPGKAADLIGIDLRTLAYSGGLHDPLAALVLCANAQVDLAMVNGQVRVRSGELLGVDLPALIERQNRLAEALVRRTEKRYGTDLSQMVWRRAFPYDN
ncbi:MAG TPA: 8-oxoguanine deaminase [Anaerolineaceae bacterium]|jgi:cytosine/adenosine deaminase-related metal-dependent hydrolase